MFKFLKARKNTNGSRKIWTSPPHWIEPEYHAPRSRREIERQRRDQLRLMRQTGIW